MIETFLNDLVTFFSSIDFPLFVAPFIIILLASPIRFLCRQLYSSDCSFHSCLSDSADPEPEVDEDLKKYYDYKV